MPPTILAEPIFLAESTIADESGFKPIFQRKSELNVYKKLKTTLYTQNDSIPSHSAQSGEVATQSKQNESKMEIVWLNVILFIYIHIAALYGLYLMFTSAMLATRIFSMSYGVMSGIGITGGAHRLWAHKSYKAKLPARIILMIWQTMAFQNSIYEWVRDHRVHHKFTDTNADPHNASRGFFFSHMGWLCCKKHPDVMKKGKTIDMSDLDADSVVVFQKKYFYTLMPIFAFIIPMALPIILWGELFSTSFYVAAIFRWVLSLHFTWLVNSWAHLWGTKPYDKNIGPVESMLVVILSNGEGYHNYHHTFPWDYKAAELGDHSSNLTTLIIDIFAKLGWTYDLKTVDKEMIKKRVLRTGDGSHKWSQGEVQKQIMADKENNESRNHHSHHHDDENLVWGWDDPDMVDDDKKLAKIINKEN